MAACGQAEVSTWLKVLLLLPVLLVEAGEGGRVNRTPSIVCPGLLANPGPTSKKSNNLSAQRVKASAYR